MGKANRLGIAAAVAIALAALSAADPSAMAAENKRAALDLDGVNAAAFSAKAPESDKPQPWIVRAQILLDRMNLSPGVIDGHEGENFANALREFQRRNDLEASGRMDAQTWDRLVAASPDEPVLREYAIAAADVKGPFTRAIPDDLVAQAELDRLGYTGPQEALAEKFHMDEDLLAALNPGAEFSAPGTRIVVAAVARPTEGKVARIEVDKAQKSVRAFGEDDRLIAFYPASIGSDARPAPSGELKVNAVAERPAYYYSPELNFSSVKTDRKLKIAAGPNNPVGSAWIDLSEDTYGIHGTPEPSKVGKVFSHGCVRLTNWDVEQLAKLVKKGVPVVFIEGKQAKSGG